MIVELQRLASKHKFQVVLNFWAFIYVSVILRFCMYLISVLSIVPPKKKPEVYDQARAVSENQIEVFRSGIIDKTAMYEAGDDFGMKYAIWVKYPLSLFTIITVGNIAYS
jgi:hypothetical protein